jgi:Asp/Glu/hydantoin racemase
MRDLMERRGLLDRYDTIIAAQEELERERRVRAKRSQRSIIIMGCAGMVTILIMMIVVFTIIIVKMGG